MSDGRRGEGRTEGTAPHLMHCGVAVTSYNPASSSVAAIWSRALRRFAVGALLTVEASANVEDSHNKLRELVRVDGGHDRRKEWICELFHHAIEEAPHPELIGVIGLSTPVAGDIVLHGHAVFEIDGERVDAPAGTMVFAPPRTKRTAYATEEGTTILALEGTPGKAYEARGWELWAPLASHYEAGEYAAVADRLRAVVAAAPQYPMLFFNLACCESLCGRTSEALDHLRHAIEMSDEFRDSAKDDSDLDPIRHEPEFKQLINS